MKRYNAPPLLSQAQTPLRRLLGLLFTLALLLAMRPDAMAQTWDVNQPSGLTLGTGTTTWNTGTKHVCATIRIPSGSILIIDGIEVQFHDTKLQTGTIGNSVTSQVPTRIVIEYGGKLELRNGATLTTLHDSGYPTAYMWDGIVLLGDSTYDQSYNPADSSSNQAFAFLKASTIKNARIALLMGRPSYSSRQLAIASSKRNGGGWSISEGMLFQNCHTGAHIASYRPANSINRNMFKDCTFRADAPLADSYYTSSGTNYGSQYGVRAFDTGRVYVIQSTFEVVPSSTFPVQPYQLRGYGLWTNNGCFNAQQNTFRKLYYGMWLLNFDLAYSMFASQNVFEGNISGAVLQGVVGAKFVNNTFKIGYDDFQFPYGLSFYNSPGYTARDNEFVSYTAGCDDGPCPYARGLNVTLSDGPPDAENPIANEVYRNNFRDLSTGIYVQRGNTGLQLRCNSFRGPARTTNASLSRADIEVLIGTSYSQSELMDNSQGDCVPDAPAKPANNIFSHTGGSAKSFLNGSSGYPTLYYYYAPSTYTAPLSYSSVLSPISCTLNGNFDYSTACPDPSTGGGGRSVDDWLAELDTTTDAQARSILLNLMLQAYLNDTTGTYTLDSAIAVLEGVGEGTDSYADILAGLRVRGGYSSGSRGVAGSTAGRTTTTDSYYQQVHDLLAPLGDDEAITTELLSNGTLRAQLEAIANDTTTWGYVAGQGALTRYLGYHYEPWYESSAELEALRHTPLSTPKTPTQTIATLYPNPTTGAVQVSYQLSSGTAAAQLLIYDALGRLTMQAALTGAGETTLRLDAVPSGLYSYRIVADGHMVQTGKVVKLP